MKDAASTTLRSAAGEALGSGIFDRRDPAAAWRRFSWEEGVEFDESYLLGGLREALDARSDEACQRLIHGDADYLPGIRLDRFGEVLVLACENAAAEGHSAWLVETLREWVGARETVLMDDLPSRRAFGLAGARRTASGGGLKGFWCDLDGIHHRIDPLDSSRPVFPLDLREQHALVGSLCAGRRVLEVEAECGGFALQAVRAGAAEVLALAASESACKSIRAGSQKNGLPLESQSGPAADFLARTGAGSYDALILNPEALDRAAEIPALLAAAVRALAPGGLLACYLRQPQVAAEVFEAAVCRALAEAGEGGPALRARRAALRFSNPTELSREPGLESPRFADRGMSLARSGGFNFALGRPSEASSPRRTA